jgi:glycosyltransferase involved in cell wall biosynthesis
MNRLAIVVQRCHENVIGGSEAEAWHYAKLLKKSYQVHILTTTAIDLGRWDNVLNEGDEIKDGVRIKRFKISQGRAGYWDYIHMRLVDEFNRIKSKSTTKLVKELIEWPVPLQEEFIYKQGPYSDDLMAFLSQEHQQYRAIIFITYLYPTTYFGMFNVPQHKILFVPTLHDEPPAYLSAYKYMAKRPRIILWNTDSEYRFGRLLWGKSPSCIIGMAVETKEFLPAELDFSYILYCGRIDINKGCTQLVDYFLKYKKDRPSNLHLILTGDSKIKIPPSRYIIFKGIVSEGEKLRLMSGANIFIMPSPNESFSIVTLEAMAQKTSILASNGSEVIVEHIRKSGGGLLYHDYNGFKKGIDYLLENKSEASKMGDRGREYVVKNYDAKNIFTKLKSQIEAID